MLTSALLDSQSSLLLCYPSFQARSVPSLDAKTLASVLTWPNPASRGRGQVTPPVMHQNLHGSQGNLCHRLPLIFIKCLRYPVS